MKLILSLFIIFSSQLLQASNPGQEEEVRYILIEAPCKKSFPALPNQEQKVILSNVFKVEFENPFAMVNAEPDLVVKFEVALDQAYPNSRNQIKDIMIYMLNTEKEAKELLKRKKNQLKTQDTGVIVLKLK
jgi:hypothetical protein